MIGMYLEFCRSTKIEGRTFLNALEQSISFRTVTVFELARWSDIEIANKA